MRYDNPEYRKWIRQQPCTACKAEIDIQPHHWQTPTNHGVGLKPDDTWCMPLCGAHHHEIHSKGKLTCGRKWWKMESGNGWALDNLAAREIRDLLAEYHIIQEDKIRQARADLETVELEIARLKK